MTTPIVVFLVLGALFGLATYSHRHLFSEGPTSRDEPGAKSSLRPRLMWAVLCTGLWPILALTGLHSAWLLARRRAAASRRPRD